MERKIVRIYKPIRILITCSLLAAIIGILMGFFVRAVHQKQLNHALIDSIKASDAPAALAALQSGANPNSYLYSKNDDDDTHGKTALVLVIEGTEQSSSNQNQTLKVNTHQEPVELVKALLDKGANPNLKDDGRLATPLFYAAEAGFESCVRLLLQRGADVNGHDIMGYTPLVLAASKNHPSTLRILLDNGANVNMKTVADETPLEYVNQLPNTLPEIKTILRKAGGKTNKELEDTSHQTSGSIAGKQ